MKPINLDEYDLSYDIQYMDFMLKLLEPYITFKFPNQTLPNEKLQYEIKIYRNIDYDWKSILCGGETSIFHLNHMDKKKLEIISLEEYIYFIQCIFPRIIQSEIRKNKEELCYEECKQDIIREQRKTNPRFKLPMFIDLTNNTEKLCISFLEEINGCNKGGLELMKEQNKKKLEEIPRQISYLEKVQEINREKNGSIKDVIYFIKNLDYMGLRDFLKIP